MLKKNYIIIGGVICGGKSTIIDHFHKHTNYKAIPEFDHDSKLFKTFLSHLYKGQAIESVSFQYYVLNTRINNYINQSKNDEIVLFERSVLEDAYFAREFIKDPFYYDIYKQMYKNYVLKMIEVGLPRVYIFLTINWTTFKERLFKRNRQEEINDFENNKEYFKKSLTEYPLFMKKVFEDYNINYKIIDVSHFNKQDIIKMVENEI